MSTYDVAEIVREHPLKPVITGMLFSVSTPRVIIPAGQSLTLVLKNIPTATGDRYLVTEAILASVLTEGKRKPTEQEFQWGGVYGGVIDTTGMSPLPISPLHSKIPPFTTTMQAFYTVGVSPVPGTILGDSPFTLFATTSTAGEGTSRAVFIESHKDGTEAALVSIVADTKIEPAPSSRRMDVNFITAASPGWFAQWTPVSGIGVDLAPICLWAHYEDGDMEGFVADENGHVREAKTLPGFIGYLPATGTGIA